MQPLVGFVRFDNSYSATNAINAMDDYLLGHKRLEVMLEFTEGKLLQMHCSLRVIALILT